MAADRRSAAALTPPRHATGFVWGLCGGLGIGLPPVLHFGSDYLKDKACAPDPGATGPHLTRRRQPPVVAHAPAPARTPTQWRGLALTSAH